MPKVNQLSKDLGVPEIPADSYQSLLSLLSPRQLLIVQLYYQEQKTISAIAEQLELGITTIAHQRRVALHIFKKELDPGYKKEIDDVKTAVIAGRI